MSDESQDPSNPAAMVTDIDTSLVAGPELPSNLCAEIVSTASVQTPARDDGGSAQELKPTYVPRLVAMTAESSSEADQLPTTTEGGLLNAISEVRQVQGDLHNDLREFVSNEATRLSRVVQEFVRALYKDIRPRLDELGSLRSAVSKVDNDVAGTMAKLTESQHASEHIAEVLEKVRASLRSIGGDYPHDNSAAGGPSALTALRNHVSISQQELSGKLSLHRKALELRWGVVTATLGVIALVAATFSLWAYQAVQKQSQVSIASEEASDRNVAQAIQKVDDRLKALNVTTPKPDTAQELRGVVKDELANVASSVSSIVAQFPGIVSDGEKTRSEVALMRKSVSDRFDENQQTFNATAESVKQLSERLQDVEGSINRIDAAFNRKVNPQPPEIAFVIDGGEQMQRYNFEIIRHAVGEALKASLTQYPSRRINLIWNRGKESKITFSSSDAGGISKLETSLRALNPEQGEESNWMVGLRDGLNRLSTTNSKARLIYITGRPERATTGSPDEWAMLADSFQGKKIPVWIIEVVGATPIPEPRLAELAARTGGQYVLLQLRRRTPDESGESLLQLESLLSQSLDVIPVVGGGAIK